MAVRTRCRSFRNPPRVNTTRVGGTRGGTALLVAGAAVIAAALAWIPVVGFVEAVALPALAVRLRRRAPERYAGLRTLAK